MKQHINGCREYHPYQCKLCDKAFKYRYEIDIHFTAVHASDSKPFECNKCKKRFTRKSSMEKHKQNPNACPKYGDSD